MTEKRRCVCFAYFVDDKFIGWYSDSFGSITKNSPKIYGYNPDQMETIRKNFIYKIEKGKDHHFVEIIKELNPVGAALIQSGLDADVEQLGESINIELRVVDCPYYDGPNPDFDREKYHALHEAQNELMRKEGIFDIPAPSKERSDAVEKFYEKHGRIKCNNWVYADYKQVKEWANTPPTEFIDTIKYEQTTI